MVIDLLSASELVLCVAAVILVLMHSGKDGGLSGMFSAATAADQNASIAERNMTRLTILVILAMVANGVALGFAG